VGSRRGASLRPSEQPVWKASHVAGIPGTDETRTLSDERQLFDASLELTNRVAAARAAVELDREQLRRDARAPRAKVRRRLQAVEGVAGWPR
jgi:hypothetical protein